MDINFTAMFEEMKKMAIYGIIAKNDKDGSGLKFVRALLDNGCPPDAFLNAMMSLQENNEDNNK